MLLRLILDSVADHAVITEIFGFHCYERKRDNKEVSKEVENQQKELGILLRLILRSAALLSVIWFCNKTVYSTKRGNVSVH